MPTLCNGRLLATLTTALAAASLATACGSGGGAATTPSPAAAGGSMTLTGDVTGTWSRAGTASESTCSSSEAVIHIAGPASGDEGNLHVKSDGSVWLDAEKYGDFTATTGGTLRAGKGLDVNADIATARGKKAHITGTLSC